MNWIPDIRDSWKEKHTIKEWNLREAIIDHFGYFWNGHNFQQLRIFGIALDVDQLPGRDQSEANARQYFHEMLQAILPIRFQPPHRRHQNLHLTVHLQFSTLSFTALPQLDLPLYSVEYIKIYEYITSDITNIKNSFVGFRFCSR